jgi:hypothetical protein
LFVLLLFFINSKVAYAQECPPKGGICLTAEQRARLKKALEELNNIHKSKVELEFKDNIIIIRDWEGRIYINGGQKVPLKAKLKIGKHIDRDLETTVPIKVWYREKPPDPIFRLRIRAQIGVLLPQIIKTIKDDEDKTWPADAAIGFDFLHLGILNLAAHAGIQSVGIGPGIDITKNFGSFVNYALAYDGFKSGILTGVYFSFN